MELAVAQVTDFSNKLIEKMVKFIQKKYKAHRFEVRVHNDFSKRRTTCWGGVRNGNNFVSLALLQYAKAADAGKTANFIEYDHIARKAEIGSLKDVSWKHAVAALIAHEMAHAVQHGSVSFSARSAHAAVKHDDSAHGLFWQTIYTELRNEFVNNKAFEEISIVKKVAPKKAIRTINRDWYMKEVNKNGGRYAFYHRKTDDSVIGVLFNRWQGKVYIYNPETNEYKDTGLYDFRAARSIHFGF